MDLSFLKHHITFGLNKIFLGFKKFDFYPRYYVCVNPTVIEQSSDEIAKLNCVKFIGNRGGNTVECNALTYEINTKEPPARFCKDISLGVREGGTVTYAALQIAYYLGFKRVIIIGMDHNFAFEGKPNESKVMLGADTNHFIDNYFGYGQRWDNPDLAKSEESYRIARDIFAAEGREILDATVDGKCNIFRKVDYQQNSVAPTVAVSATAQVFSTSCSELAEGPLWHPDRSSLFWVDILSNRLYEKSLLTGMEGFWQLQVTASSIALDEKSTSHLWLITEQGLCKICLESGELVTVVHFTLADGYRTNDGSVGSDGSYWFGTMLRQPKAQCGQVFSINRLGQLKQELEQVAIPNTFCWLNPQQLLITDSLVQECKRYQLDHNQHNAQPFLSLVGTSGTPDGGAVDNKGNVWIAIWGASKVICVDATGNTIREITLPVPQPSSCCFGGANNNILFITTAREGLTSQQLAEFPDSGKIFAIQLAVQGAVVNSFSMD
ncbi:UNVERIFIED_CONTAM: yvrE [Trichonephila clavipes]